jgi:hypothetical protein
MNDRRGLTLDELRGRGHRVTAEMLAESAATGLLVERAGVWFWTEAAERDYGDAFRVLPAEDAAA